MSKPESHPRCAKCNAEKEEGMFDMTGVEIVSIFIIFGIIGYFLLELIQSYFSTH